MHPSNATTTRRNFAKSITALGLATIAAPRVLAQTAATPDKPAKRIAPVELNAFPSPTPWALMGMGALRFFGFKAYDAYLWSGEASANPLLSKSLFALEIDYTTSIKADDIANVSLVEMARIRSLSESQVKAFTADLKKAFPDVKSGDKLTGVFVPKQGTRFFFNGRLTAEINDPAFGDAFFAIWLDEKTKQPGLRKALLGQR
jgi:Chalcone isomerase-like